jgi:hypothetical protein
VVAGGQAVDPLGGGGERDPVACLAGPDGDPGRDVCLAGVRSLGLVSVVVKVSGRGRGFRVLSMVSGLLMVGFR